MSQQSLYEKEHLLQQGIEPITLKSELLFLEGKGYVASIQQLWKISTNGIEKIEELFKKFVE